MIKTLSKFVSWVGDHSIFVYGTLAIGELLYLVENHVKKDN